MHARVHVERPADLGEARVFIELEHVEEVTHIEILRRDLRVHAHAGREIELAGGELVRALALLGADVPQADDQLSDLRVDMAGRDVAEREIADRKIFDAGDVALQAWITEGSLQDHLHDVGQLVQLLDDLLDEMNSVRETE